MKLELNRDYVHRHLFVTVLMAALALWFGYDGFVRYPSTPAAELYRSIEKSDAPAHVDLESFKRQKIQTQYGFTLLAALAALIIGFRLYKSRTFDFEFDETGFSHLGRRHAYTDIARVDDGNWTKKSILVLVLTSGERITLDAWHHTGVKEFLGAWRDVRDNGRLR